VARGFLGGMIWGGILAGGSAVVLSFLVPMAPSPDVADQAPQAGTQSASVDAGPEPATRIEGVSGLGSTTSPGPDVPKPDDLESVRASGTETAQQPQVGGATSALSDPATTTSAPQVAALSDAPVAPAISNGAPSAPQDEAELSISTEPAQPAPPPVSEDSSGFDAPAAPAAPVVPETALAKPTPSVEAGPTAEAAPEPAPEAPQAIDPLPAAPRVAALPQATAPTENSGPTIGNPVVPLTERASGNSGRLPALGRPREGTSDATTGEPTNANAPPILRYAAPFANPDAKPLMSIVLIDDEAAIGAEALASFPYPLTFAINPSDPNAVDKMTRYRAAGFEVVVMVDLPAAGTASDAEVALSASLDTLPEVVALIEGTVTGVQGNRALADQVAAILKSTGHGFITQDNGLNTVQKLALRDGVPAAVVFRDFDGAGQTPTVMRRFLDQAAFRASQDGAVIMLGRVRPDTVSALLLWGLQDRAARVALAPVSTVLNEMISAQ